MDPTVDAKQAVRARVRAARRERARGPGREQAAARLAAAAAALVAQRCGKPVCRVAAYAATPAEPPTELLVARLRDAGHDVLLPVIRGDRTLAWDLDGEVLPPEALGSADVVLTPGLAVDRSGVRLGQGGGFYDVALAVVPPDVPVLTVLWDGELVDGPLPAQEHDRRVDGVLTPEHGVVWLAPRG